MAKKARPSNPKKAFHFPSHDELAQYINESPGKVGKREIARAFKVPVEERPHLRQVLKELLEDGRIERQQGRKYQEPGRLPSVLVVKITKLDADDLLWAQPIAEDDRGPTPQIFIRPELQKGPASGVGERALIRVKPVGEKYEGTVIRRLHAAPKNILGVYTEISGNGRIMPTDKRERYDYIVAAADRNGARRGELVQAEIVPGRSMGLRGAKVLERFGSVGDPRAVSLIAIHGHGIPYDFSEGALGEARGAKPAAMAKREDLRHVPLITIDGADARDFDDAVSALPDDAEDNPGGFHLLVAIADVAHYVRPNSSLDRDAKDRGNSVYFPDRVVPMLPEELSNDLCSLRPDGDRACMAVDIRIDANGRKLDHRFMRAMMRSRARLTYHQVQDAIEGNPDEACAPLLDDVIKPLYDAFDALNRERAERKPLDLDLPEMQIFLDDDGRIDHIKPRERLSSHKLIEEYMVLANVCAAQTLEAVEQPCMYRVHEQPDIERLAGLREFLGSMEISFNPSETARPEYFNRILAKAQDEESSEIISQAILRSQSQAYYGPENMGHFGLNLRRYAHFTSPIRRYSDLLVHRALISGLNLGAGGLSEDDKQTFAETAQHISDTERRAMAAERESTDRYIAAYLNEHVGAEFGARVSGIIKAGIFVRLDETHADGLIPVSTLGDDYYRLNENRRSLIGDETGGEYRMGDRVMVRLRETNQLTGSMIFEMLSPPTRIVSGEGRRRHKPHGKKHHKKSAGGKSTGGKGHGAKGHSGNPHKNKKKRSSSKSHGKKHTKK